MEAIATQTLIVESAGGHWRMRDRVILDAGKRSFSIGRSVNADVTLDDDYVAALHVRIDVLPDGRMLASDLGSVNGIVIEGTRHERAEGLPLAGGRLQIGRTRLRIRSANETLAPEKLLTRGTPLSRISPVWLVGGAAVVEVAQTAYATWLVAPTDPAIAFAGSVLRALIFVAAWAGGWALLSRIIVGQWRWVGHLAIALIVAVVYQGVSDAVDVGWFALSLPLLRSSLLWVPIAVILGVLFYLHIRLASTISVQRAALMVGATISVISAGTVWYVERSLARDVNAVTGLPARLYPDTWRLTASQPLDRFMRRMDDLRGLADRKREALSPQDGEFEE